jgi:glycosyltransferase involved in cell wall biosynthesis
MKIVLIGNYSPDRLTSMSLYALFLQRQLRLAGHEVRLIEPRAFARRLFPAGSRFAKWLGYVDKFIFFRWGFSAVIADADIVHVCDHSNSVYLPWIKIAPSVITGHDALAMRSALGHYTANPTGFSGKILQRWIRESLKHADRIIYVSEKTRTDFEQILDIHVPSDVILHSVNWAYSTAKDAEVQPLLAKLQVIKNEYLIHVGGNDWYKNRMGVLRMHAALKSNEQFRNMRLVMVGKPFTAEMREWCRTKGTDDVIELVNLKNEELRALYSGAFALLFPSLEEGFGWPLIEAQACGCPVIASNRAPLTEIAGDGAKYVDPSDPSSILDAALGCSLEREKMVQAGFRNLERFQLADMIRSYEGAYRKAISAFHSRRGKSANS